MVVKKARLTGAAPLVAGTQTFTFSLGGKTPKGYRIRVTSGTVLGTSLAPARLSVGYCDLTNQRSVALMGEDGTAVGSTDSGYLADNASVAQFPGTGSEAREAKAVHSSASANTVVINWTTAPGSLVFVECEAVYGDDALVVVGDLTSINSTTAGSNFVDLNLGFDNGILELASPYVALGADLAGADGRLAIGYVTAFDGTVKQIASTYFDRDRGSTSVRNGQSLRNDCCIHSFTVSASTGAATEGAKLVCSQVVGGLWRIETTVNAQALGVVYYAVRTNRQRVWCGIGAAVVPAGGGAPAALTTSATGTHLVRDPGFQADDVEAIGTGLVAANSTVAGGVAGKFSWGGSDGSAPSLIAYQVAPAATASSRSLLEAAFVHVINSGGGANWVAALVLGDSLGFGVNVTTASSADRAAAFVALSYQSLLAPSPVPLPLSVPAVTRKITTTPAAVVLALSAPAVARRIDVKPSAVALALSAPAVARLITTTPAAVALALSVPAVARRIDVKPAAVPMALSVPAVARLITTTPAAVVLALSAPAVASRVDLTPAAVALPLSVPAVTIRLALAPSPVLLVLSVPTVSRPGNLSPSPVDLHLAVPAPVLVRPLTPGPVQLALAVPAVSRALELQPSPVVLALVVPVVRFRGNLFVLALTAEIVRALELEAEARLTVGLTAEISRALELEAARE